MSKNNNNILEKPENYGEIIPEVVVDDRYTLGMDRKYHMDHYLEPKYGGISLARAVNSRYIDEDQIQMNPDKLRREFFETGKDFRQAKRNLRHNRRQFEKARKYAGSDQKSAADRQFYHNLGKTMTKIVSIPALGWGTGASATILTNPGTYTNFVLPMLGGEVVDELTKKASDNKYNSFGDFVYDGSGLANIANGTFMETPLRFVTGMSNPGYWAPYGKVAPIIGKGIDKLGSNLQKAGFFTPSDMPDPRTTLYSGIPLFNNPKRLPRWMHKELKQRVPKLSVSNVDSKTKKDINVFKNEFTKTDFDILGENIRNMKGEIDGIKLLNMIRGYDTVGPNGYKGNLFDIRKILMDDLQRFNAIGGQTPPEWLIDYDKVLNERVPKEKLFGIFNYSNNPNNATWWKHPLTNTFSDNAKKYLEEHTWWNAIEPWVIPSGATTATLIPGSKYNIWRGIGEIWKKQFEDPTENSGNSNTQGKFDVNVLDEDTWR